MNKGGQFTAFKTRLLRIAGAVLICAIGISGCHKNTGANTAALPAPVEQSSAAPASTSESSATSSNTPSPNAATSAVGGGGAGAPGGPMANNAMMCGGIGAIRCKDAKDYCRIEDGKCHVPDMSGMCARKPEMCTEMYAPVCGCDGKTYGNACLAGAASVSIDHTGKCAT